MKLTDVTSARTAVQTTVARTAGPALASKAPAEPVLAAAPSMVSEAALRQGVDRMNQAVKKADENLQFSVHQETNRIVVKLVDAQTDEVLREFPSEKFLDLVADLMKLAGLQVDETI
jgi:uncharacterized FlaG/YvyC family protein